MPRVDALSDDEFLDFQVNILNILRNASDSPGASSRYITLRFTCRISIHILELTSERNAAYT